MTISEPGPNTWESLSPWEKAREWRDAYPELADEIISLGKQRTRQLWELEQAAAQQKLRIEADESAQRMLLQKAEFEHRLEVAGREASLLERRAEHVAMMEARVWYLELIALIGGLAALLGNGVIAFVYARAGHALPGLAVFGAGGALTGSIYLASRDASKRLKHSLQGGESHHPQP